MAAAEFEFLVPNRPLPRALWAEPAGSLWEKAVPRQAPVGQHVTRQREHTGPVWTARTEPAFLGALLAAFCAAAHLRCTSSEGSQLSSQCRQCPPGGLGPSRCLASTLFTETLSKPAWLSILTAGAPGAQHTSRERWACSQADLPEARARLLWVSVLHQTQMWLLASSVQQFFQGPSFMDDMVPSFWNLLVICLPAAQGSHVQDPAFESGVTIDPTLIPLAGPASPTL